MPNIILSLVAYFENKPVHRSTLYKAKLGLSFAPPDFHLHGKETTGKISSIL
jgi:hypothetical protein